MFFVGKRHTRWSYKSYVRFVKNGRGTGDLSEYKPWITVHDFPSNGKVARILGKKTNPNNRNIDLLFGYAMGLYDIIKNKN